MKKFCAILILCCLLPLGGCGGGEDLTQVNIYLDWAVNTNHSGLYLAQERDYFAQEGLKVNILPAPDTGNIALTAQGRQDFAFAYQEDVMMAVAQEIPVTAIASVVQHNTSGFVFPRDSGIAGPKDFAGKTYGGWGSPMETAILQTLMEQEGADFATLEMINMGSTDLLTALEKGIDFTWEYEAWGYQMAQLKAYEVDFLALRDLDPVFDFYTPVIICSEELAGSDPELARGFLRGLSRGYSDATQEPEAAAAALLAANPELDPELVGQSQEYIAGLYQGDAPYWGYIDSQRWEAFGRWLGAKGLLAQETTGGYNNALIASLNED